MSTPPDNGGTGGPGGIPVAPNVSMPEAALDFTFSSSSGPGGQNVNKRATKCTLRLRVDSIPIPPVQQSRLVHSAPHLVTASAELIIPADEYRSQERNKAACLERLRDLIVAARIAPKVRRATKPSRGSKERRIREKKSRADIKRGRRETE